MNIGQLLRGLVGETKPLDEGKALELKVGQIVKGIVLQLLSDQEALLNIGGVHVKAKLETPLRQGQSTLLQVQPQSSPEHIVMKPLDAADTPIDGDTVTQLLRSFGMKDQPEHRQLLQQLHREGVAPTKETVESFVKLAAGAPAGIDPAAWRESALTAVRRGLPLTAETTAALHRVLFGEPLPKQLGEFVQLAANALRQDETAPQLPQQAREALQQAAQQAQGVLRLTAQAQQQLTAAAQPNEPSQSPAPATAAAPQATAAGAASPAVAAQPLQSGTSPAQLPQGAPAAGAAGMPQAPASPATAPQAEPGAAVAQRSGEAPPQAAPAALPAAPAEAEAGGAWIGKLLKALGVGHERQLVRLPDDAPAARLPQSLLPGAPGEQDAPQSPQAQQASGSTPQHAQAASDSLKSALLVLAATDGVPETIKESAQQALQHITGQQLLLTGDRNGMLAHVTLSIPFYDTATGEQAAAVHIQTRKGKRGELDADNCRLLFDLRMKALGQTLVDVHVYNRIVTLHVHNDHPLAGELLESHRQEITSGLAGAGFQFLSLKCSPFPEPDPTDVDADTVAVPPVVDRSLYRSKPYKGVDMRI
ncbi:hypothetical protein [Paenibacillus cymbidii]|uniref:hypothetical protein n=1 Tax=Paenibacillus cymbidii TaxID=1639034 RepID=UPI0010805874|nr:hypothetical protein [Paenibacillus cymbidii]